MTISKSYTVTQLFLVYKCHHTIYTYIYQPLKRGTSRNLNVACLDRSDFKYEMVIDSGSQYMLLTVLVSFCSITAIR